LGLKINAPVGNKSAYKEIIEKIEAR